MKILTNKYLDLYISSLKSFEKNIKYFFQSSKNISFDYLTESSSVFSSNIEGNSLDLSSFKNLNINKSITKDVKEIENLIKAYSFAQTNELNEKNLLNIHNISSKTLLIKSKRGIYRNDKVGVFGKTGLVYLAVEAEYVQKNMNKLFCDIKLLLSQDLKKGEIFYYASFIHLVFVHIHPFTDGNGRCARLLEKWFITKKLGQDFWKLRSEEYYKNNRNNYYENINLGVNYYELNYDKCLNFLLMLPNSLEI